MAAAARGRSSPGVTAAAMVSAGSVENRPGS